VQIHELNFISLAEFMQYVKWLEIIRSDMFLLHFVYVATPETPFLHEFEGKIGRKSWEFCPLPLLFSQSVSVTNGIQLSQVIKRKPALGYS
jgi:hypothetical protein